MPSIAKSWPLSALGVVPGATLTTRSDGATAGAWWENYPGQNTGVGSFSILQENLPNPGIKPRSPTLQEDSLPAELKGSPRILEWVVYPFTRGSSRPRNRTGVSCRWILYQLSYHRSCEDHNIISMFLKQIFPIKEQL